MNATFGGCQVYSRKHAAAWLASRAYAIPEDFARANSISNPLGRAPAVAYLLMIRKDIDSLDQNELQDIVLTDDLGTTMPLAGWVFVVARNLVPGAVNDPNALYLVEAADSRWRCHNPHWHVPIDAAYNVRAPGWGGSDLYYAGTTNAGTAWTWEGMVQDVWGLMATQLGEAPALPFTPHGTPEGFIFPGMSAWHALNQILARIGCAVSCDLTQSGGSQYGIVQIGAEDAAQDARQVSLETAGRKLYDEEFQEAVRGREPYGVRVFFHGLQQDFGTEQSTAQNSTQWFTAVARYHVDVAGPDQSGAENAVYHEIWDDLPAIYDGSGTLTNGDDLTARATERANDYYRMLVAPGGTKLHKVYSGLAPFYAGSTIKGVAWRQDDKYGWATEIVRHPGGTLIESDGRGRWREHDAGSTALQAPDFRPGYPAYPPMPQVVQIVTGTPSSGLYDAAVNIYDPATSTWTTKESVWALDLKAAASLTVGDRFLGRLAGYQSSRPVYEIGSAGTGDDTSTGITWTSEGFFFGDAPPGGGGGNITVLTFTSLTIASPASYTLWWDTTLGLAVYNGTTVCPLTLEATSESGLDTPGVGIINFLNETGGVTFAQNGDDAHQIDVKLVSYQGCTGSAAGIIGGVPAAAATKQDYTLGGDATWKRYLEADANSVVAAASEVLGPVYYIRLDSDLGWVCVPDGGDANRANFTQVWSSGQIQIGQPTSGKVQLKLITGDITLPSSGAVTVVALQGKPVSSTPPTDAQTLLFDGTSWNPKTFSGDITVTDSGGGTVEGWKGKSLGSTFSGPSANDLPSFDGTAWKAGKLSDLLDAVFGSTQGSVLYRGASAWAALAPGTDGDVLTTHGSGADPTWAAGGGGGGSTSPIWTKYTLNYNDANIYVAHIFATITLRSMAAGEVLHAYKIEVSPSWSCSTSPGMDIGFSGSARPVVIDSPGYYSPDGRIVLSGSTDQPIVEPSTNVTNQITTLPDCENQSSGWDVTVTIYSNNNDPTNPSNPNLNTMTQGSLNIWLLTSTPPS